MDDKVLVRLGHGYYNGGITPLPYFCPTIDAHIDCWHILIGEKMKNEDIKCECVGMLGGEKYEKMHDIARRVYDTNGIAPTQHTCGGGNLETKVVVVDGFNQSIRADQTCFGTITRNAGADLKRNGQGIIEIVGEPLALDEQNGYIRQDGTVGTLTTDGSSPKHNNRVVENYRIRKLTPKECGRLMGVRDDDIDKMSVNQSNSSLFHCFGDSIVVDVLMAIFKQML